jgi:hypothetical protein
MFRMALKVSGVDLKLHHPEGGVGIGEPNCFLLLSFSWVKTRLNTESKLPRLLKS